MFCIDDRLFDDEVTARVAPYAASQLLPDGVHSFVNGLRAAAAKESFVSEKAARLWLETMVDHFFASQSHGECAQHSMMVLTQTSLQAMLSVRHTVMDNTMTNRYIGSIVPHLAKSVLCPIKHPTACTMIVSTKADSYVHTYSLAKALEHRLIIEFSASAVPHNIRTIHEHDHAFLFRVARLAYAELFGPAELVGVALEWLASDVRCALSHTWPSEFATNWNHANGAQCFAVARDRPLSVVLFLPRPVDAVAQIVDLYNPPKRKPNAREGDERRGAAAKGKGKDHARHQQEVVDYALYRMSLACHTTAVNDAVAWETILRRKWLPLFLNARALGIVGIQSAWVARYSCPISKNKDDRRRYCVKTRGSNIRTLIGGAFAVEHGGVVDRSTAASDDLSSSTGMGLFGVDTAVAYLCHEEVARANGVFAEHIFVLGMLLSHSGVLANVSGKGYTRLGADFCGQIAVEDIRSALHQVIFHIQMNQRDRITCFAQI